MSKRFTDTEKWKKEFFCELSPKMKLAWLFLCDACDHAGIWSINMVLLSFHTGFKTTIDELCAELGDKLEVRDNKIFLTTFIDYQYGELNPNNKVHKSALKLIEKLAPAKGLASPMHEAKDKDKDKDKELKEGSMRGVTKIVTDELESAYKAYPRKVGRGKGMTRLKAQSLNLDEARAFKVAVDKYCEYLRSNNTEKQYVKHFSTFVAEWRDWVEPNAGKVEILSKSENAKKYPEYKEKNSWDQAQGNGLTKVLGENNASSIADLFRKKGLLNE